MPTPKMMLEDTASYPAELRTLEFPKGKRDLRIQVVRNILWYRSLSGVLRRVTTLH